ncbi:hypothetical protein [Streptomyces sp. NPDC048473]|uniref:hypothetical protein n=1 Tax=unclassified Streptomyces TaxID=2593676 RepID=UPI0037160217
MFGIAKKSIVTALTLALVSFGPSEALADSGEVTRTTLSSDAEIQPGVTVELVKRTLALSSGEKRHLRGRLEATSSTTGIVGLTNRIKCVDSKGAAASVVAASARNHEGYDTDTYAVPGHLPIYADLLLTAPATDVYTCRLYGSAYSSLTGDYHLTAVAESTWLEVSDSDQTGAEWWQNSACESADDAGNCTYVGSGPANPDAWIFYNDGTPLRKWQAAPSASAVAAQANVEFTTCYKGTASCADAMQQYARGTDAVVDTRFEFVQLDTTGHTCRTNSTSSRKTISDDGHHYVAYFALPDVPIDSSCGTRTFILRVYVKHVSGQTVKIDGIQNGVTSLTNAIAFNQFR